MKSPKESPEEKNKPWRRWTFTINNYTDDQVNQVLGWENDRNISGCVAGFEVGKNGTPHIQGCIMFKAPKRFSEVRKIVKGWHVEKMRESWKCNVKYCSKDEDLLINKQPSQGERVDIINYVDDIKHGKLEGELWDSEHTAVWAKYQHIYPRVRAQLAAQVKNNFRKLNVTVLWGPPGSGKTSSIVEEHPDIYFAQPDLRWWPQYDGQDVILIDDFYGQCRPSWLLRILDGYQLQVEYKGGHTYARWTKVFITSNVHPVEWYKDIPDDVRGAIMRRINSVEEVHH
jgi:hypothetical protein